MGGKLFDCGRIDYEVHMQAVILKQPHLVCHDQPFGGM